MIKQNIIIDTKDGKVKVQFEHCLTCKDYKFCYFDSNSNYHKQAPNGLNEDCLEPKKYLV